MSYRPTEAPTRPNQTGAANPWRRNPGVHGIGASSLPRRVSVRSFRRLSGVFWREAAPRHFVLGNVNQDTVESLIVNSALDGR